MGTSGTPEHSAQPQFLPPEPADAAPEPTAPEGPPPAAPETAPGPSPRPRRKPWLYAAGAAALAALAASAAVWGLSGSDKTPDRYTSLPAPCGTITSATLGKYAPGATARALPPTNGSAGQRAASCHWEQPLTGARDQETASHDIDVLIRLYSDPRQGLDTARSAYTTAWQAARDLAGTSENAGLQVHSEAPTLLPGVGDQAFTQHAVAGGLSATGKVEATVRVRNALIVVGYEGATFLPGSLGTPRQSQARPLDEAQARAGAEAAARDAAAALAACKPCLTTH
ncbi:hypothetical protein [Actinomadura parmotrematis]|uniref:DUF3558 domain-containing protein n=1 Tax=Actinomadura parmotrematis TaxID=2864039 RepID=A0ABS7G079_9ACTN|nr:hypothetical protein [Actinomadura parmotrematis]MBW8485274.1 hypothetical protein [Actinomadura parmotrematis]